MAGCPVARMMALITILLVLRLGRGLAAPSPAEAAEDQRARDPRAEPTRRRRRPTGGGTGRECRPSPSTAAAGLERCQAPRLGRSAGGRAGAGAPARRRGRRSTRTVRPAGAAAALRGG